MKKDNKGFSLVELIVVVLIMGILAVALTPQVLRWVERSRIADDFTTMDTVKSALQTTLTNETVFSNNKTTQIQIVLKKGTSTISGSVNDAAGNNLLTSYLGGTAVTDIHFKSDYEAVISTNAAGTVTATMYNGSTHGSANIVTGIDQN